MVGLCLDYLASLPIVAKGELTSVLQEKRSLETSQLENLFPISKAVHMHANSNVHPFATRIREILSLIEQGSVPQNQKNSAIDESMASMEDALQKKNDLRKELDDFETKQNFMIYGTVAFVAIWGIILCFCCIFKREKPTDKGKDVEIPEAEQKKMVHLVNTLGRMDEEIVKMKEELKLLKERKKTDSHY